MVQLPAVQPTRWARGARGVPGMCPLGQRIVLVARVHECLCGTLAGPTISFTPVVWVTPGVPCRMLLSGVFFARAAGTDVRQLGDSASQRFEELWKETGVEELWAQHLAEQQAAAAAATGPAPSLAGGGELHELPLPVAAAGLLGTPGEEPAGQMAVAAAAAMVTAGWSVAAAGAELAADPVGDAASDEKPAGKPLAAAAAAAEVEAAMLASRSSQLGEEGGQQQQQQLLAGVPPGLATTLLAAAGAVVVVATLGKGISRYWQMTAARSNAFDTLHPPLHNVHAAHNCPQKQPSRPSQSCGQHTRSEHSSQLCRPRLVSRLGRRQAVLSCLCQQQQRQRGMHGSHSFLQAPLLRCHAHRWHQK